MNNLISQDYLMHHGVKGMKWGVRHDNPSSGRGKSRNKLNLKGYYSVRKDYQNKLKDIDKYPEGTAKRDKLKKRILFQG